MKNKKTIISTTLLVFIFFIVNSCTDLNEQTYSSVTADSFFKTDQQATSALGAAYSHLGFYANGNTFNMEEVTTDEMVVPTRGHDWYDGGHWLRLHRHTWTVTDPSIEGGWNELFGGVATCNRLIFQFSDLADKGSIDQAKADKYTGELKVLRAFYYYWLLDLYGNVPIVTGFKDVSSSPSQPSPDFQEGRKKVFDFVEKEIKDNIDALDSNVDLSTYGRMTKWAAHFLLAKLYLNAKVYIGTPRYSDAVEQCNAIINSGNFHLAGDFFGNFKTENQNSPEFIFAIPYDAVNLTGHNMHMRTLHTLSQFTFNLKAQPWNGFATMEDFYNTFKDSDQRKDGFLVGYQKDASGNYLIDNSTFEGEPHGDTLYFTPHINEIYPEAWREGGARFNKFSYASGSTANLDNDFPVFRYADVLLTKAEAMWRAAGAPDNYGDADALALVNMVRERAGLSDYSSLDAYKILMERGHELYTELWRRQDLLRYKGNIHFKISSDGSKGAVYDSGPTAFNDAWWEKEADMADHNIYPIPFTQLQANKNLVQNPGY